MATRGDFALLHDPRVGAMRRDLRVSRDAFRVVEKT
jgi:hypothetical protein